MKFLITGDWHIDRDRIKTRKDNVFETCIDKLGQIFTIAYAHKVDAILQPGDFFESHRTSDYVKQFVISFLKDKVVGKPIMTVFGQHDLRYHNSNIDNTPLKVLQSSGIVHFLSDSPVTFFNDVRIYGASWFEDIPEIVKVFESGPLNILVCHKMIVDTKIWEGQEDHIFGNILLKKTKFDLIVSGDNHKHFVIRSGKRLLVNCGSLLRTRIDQEDHKPCVYIYDTDPKLGAPFIEQVFLKVEDFHKVIRVETAKRVKAENEKLQQFVDALSIDPHLSGINYKRNVYAHINHNKDVIDNDTRQFIDWVFEEVEKR
jgi:DNA repair exonuclease SbcCD nuclease subunit